jgi:hypothetical protein
MRPRAAVTIETEPKYVTLYPSVNKTVHLQLRNYQPEPIEATIALAPAPGLEVDWSERTIVVPAKSYAGAPVTLRAPAGGVYDLQATAHIRGAKARPQHLSIFCLEAGAVRADVNETEARMENEWTRVILQRHRGRIEVRTAKNAWLGGGRESVGPPFWPSELDDKEFTVDLAREDGRVRAVMTAALDERPGLVLRREVILGAGPLIEMHNAWINNGTAAQAIQLQFEFSLGQRDGATIVLPLSEGLVENRFSEFPAAEQDVSKQPDAFAERWAAVTSQHGTFGVIWSEDVVENEIGGWNWMGLLGRALDCEPHRWTQAGTMALYAGPGDWRAVRDHARRLAGTDGDEEPIPLETRAVHGARLAPSPLVTLDDQAAATLVVDNLRARPLSGHARLALPEGLHADQGTLEIERVTLKEPFEREIHLSLGPRAAAYQGTLSLETQVFDAEIPLHAVRLGTRDPVAVSQADERWTIDNGRTRYTVAPGFSGSLSAWIEDGIDHLISPYPEVKTFGWMSPWYGGLMPLAMVRDEMPGKLGQEAFTAERVEARDARGIDWTGVRVRCEVAREQLAGLALELDYLTVGHSNVLKLVCRVHNGTTAKRSLGCGWLSFWQLDGTREHNTLHSATVQRKPTPWGSWSEAGKWGLVTNAETGRTAVLVSPYPAVRLIDWDDMGGHVGLIDRMSIPASGSAERVCYLALCPDMDEARRYTCLQDYL